MGFFDGLTKVIHAGVAYAEHVQFVEKAQQAQPQELQSLLLQYVQSLSPASFNGFKITLGMLASKAQTEQRKVLIRTLLANADAARDANPTPIATEETVASTTEETAFDRDLKLVHQWNNLPDKNQALNAAEEHIISLMANFDEFRGFLANVNQMRDNACEQKKQHENNETKAWGGFIEDQINYQLARLRTGQRDPEFVRKLHEFDDFITFTQCIDLKAKAIVEEYIKQVEARTSKR